MKKKKINEKRCILTGKLINNKEVIIASELLNYIEKQGFNFLFFENENKKKKDIKKVKFVKNDKVIKIMDV